MVSPLTSNTPLIMLPIQWKLLTKPLFRLGVFNIRGGVIMVHNGYYNGYGYNDC